MMLQLFLAKKIHKQKTDINFKYCALIIDAMAIKSSMTYDKSSGHYIGFCDFGKDITVCEPDTPATCGFDI